MEAGSPLQSAETPVANATDSKKLLLLLEKIEEKEEGTRHTIDINIAPITILGLEVSTSSHLKQLLL